MRVALPFKINYEYNDKIDEFIINYDSEKNDFSKLVNFITTYSDKIININIKKEIDFDQLESLNKIGKIKIILKPEKMSLASIFVEKNIKFYFKEGLVPANYHQLHAIIALGVSDIYIHDDLCYEMSNVKRYCKEKGVNLRVCLNRIPHSIGLKADQKIVFYRPEERFFEEYFDIAEFDLTNEKGKFDWDRMNVLYKVYFVDKRWYGNLQDIILDLPFEVYNKSLIPEFGEYKNNCKLKCKNRHSVCRKCSQLLDIANLLVEKNVRFDFN